MATDKEYKFLGVEGTEQLVANVRAEIATKAEAEHKHSVDTIDGLQEAVGAAADSKFYVVTFDRGDDNQYHGDLTFAEIREKFEAGGNMVARIDGTDYIPLLSAAPSQIIFSGIYKAQSVSLTINSNDICTLTTTQLANSSHSHTVASTTSDGFMSKADKTKLDGIDTGAEVNVIESISVNGEALPVTNKTVSIEIPDVGSIESNTSIDVELTSDEQLEVESTITTLQSLKKANTSVIAFLADLHIADWNVTNTENIKKTVASYNMISSEVKTDLMLLGGDYLDNSTATSKEMALDWYSDLRNIIECRNNKPPMAVIKGNHDDNTMYTDYINGLVDAEAFWSALGNIDDDRTVRNGGNIEDCYGYYDISNQKVRVFYVNTVDLPQKLYTALNKLNYRGQWDTGISVQQLQFIADNLKFDSAGWHVMFFSHHPFMYDISIENGCGVTAARGGAALLELLEKFNTGGTAGSISVTAQDFEGTVTYDFTSNEDCKIVACVNGHTHRDSVDMYNDSFFCISTRAVADNISAYFVIDRNNTKLHLVYNGDGEENVFNYGSLTTGEEEVVEPVYEEIASPYTFGINNLNYDTGKPVYDAKEFWVVSEEICGFTKPTLIDLSGYDCMYKPVWFDTDGNFISVGGDGWISKDTVVEVPADQPVRILARNNNWSTWTDEKVAAFTSAIKVYVEEGGEAYTVNEALVEIASPFQWQIGGVNDNTGEPEGDSQNMRISSTEIIGFTTPAIIDMSGYSSMYVYYLYDTDGNYIERHDGTWISSDTQFELPIDRTVRFKIRNNNYELWTDDSINTFASAIKVYVEEGGESYIVGEEGTIESMYEIASPFTFTINMVDDSTGEIVEDSANMRITSPIVGFTTPAIIDMSAYENLDDAVYQLYWYDTEGNYTGEYSTEWVPMSTRINVPTDKTVRIKIRYSNYYPWTDSHRIPEVEGAIKVYVEEEGGESYIVNTSEPVIELGKPLENVVYCIGCSVSTGSVGIAVYGHDGRMTAVTTHGVKAFADINNCIDEEVYPFAIPADATKITIVCPEHIYGIGLLKYENDAYTRVVDAGWQTLGGGEYSFEAGTYSHVAINFKNSSNTTIPTDTDTSGFSIMFE